MSTHLYRSRDDRMLAGVAGGLADLWDADPSLVRIIWALLVVLTGGIALVVYIVMAIVVPEESDVRPWAGPPAGWTPPAGSAAGSGTPGGPPPAAPGDSPAEPGTPAAPPAPAAAGWPTPPVPTGGWPQTRFEAREAARAARHEARAARHAARGRDGRSGGIVIGTLFVLLGAWFLVREYLPSVDWDWFWPLTLVALGVVVLYFAVRPRSDDSGGTGTPGGSAG